MAGRTVRLSDRAAQDLDAIHRWQTQPGAGGAASRRLRAIISAIRQLEEIPCLHVRGRRPGTREMSVEGHRVVYRVSADSGDNATAGDVVVLRVFGPGQWRG
jgi:plasmid stabilization system protein ParE